MDNAASGGLQPAVSDPCPTFEGMTSLGLIFPPDQPPERLRDVAHATEAAGLDELWLWEDCFKESGIATAAAVLAWTDRLSVGIGLLPVPLRNVALTAMEIATLARLFPGRLLPGIGHGVLDWMGQVGARVESPMTLLREYTHALQALLAGQTVTTTGRYVQLDDVTLDWPPEQVPPVLVGAWRPKTMELAGALGDGVIVDNPDALVESVRAVRKARADAGRAGPPDVVAFLPVRPDAPPEVIAPKVREHVEHGATRVVFLATGEDGGPWGDAGLVEFAGVIGDVRAQL